MTALRFGVIGAGGMGHSHAKCLDRGEIKGATLSAVCDLNPDAAGDFPELPFFDDAEAMMRSGKVDAVMIATPHYSHTTLGIAALEAGLHTLVEKPISVHKQDCEKLINAYTDEKLVFGAMFNQRTDARYRKARELIQSGELGKLMRVQWTITDWFRSQAYYDAGGWRATWEGEGGGVLLNQCPHQLDLYQWLVGMPDRVRAFCHFGKYHDIEVEDEVTAYLEYDSGLTGVFITSTGEAPGTNRLEIIATKGKLTVDDPLIFERNATPIDEFNKATEERFATPEKWRIEVPAGRPGEQHKEILQNFTDTVKEGATLLAPAVEGIHSVELANAMLLSGWTGETVELPIDAGDYAKRLKKKIEGSTFEKKVNENAARKNDLSGSF